MAAGVVKKGKVSYTPCRVAKGYNVGKAHGGQFMEAEMCGGRKKAGGKKKKSGGRRKAAGKTASGKKVGLFKGKGGRCFRRLKSGKTKPVKKALCRGK